MSIEEFKQQQATQFYDALAKSFSPLSSAWSEKEQPFPLSGGVPRSVAGYPYGIDTSIHLLMTADTQGFTSPLWMDFDQIKRAGGGVNSGEKHTKVLRFTSENKPFLAQYFNADQCYGLPENLSKPLPSPTLIQLDEVVKKMGVRVEHDSKAHPYFHVNENVAILPPKSHYTKNSPFGSKGYYADLVDSVVRESFKCNELEEGSEESAKRHLRAEIATTFACARLGLPRRETPHMQWMDQYAERRPNHREIQEAISDAEKMLKVYSIERVMVAEPVQLSERKRVVAPASEPASTQEKVIEKQHSQGLTM